MPQLVAFLAVVGCFFFSFLSSFGTHDNFALFISSASAEKALLQVGSF
jgi:hypothetical protein